MMLAQFEAPYGNSEYAVCSFSFLLSHVMLGLKRPRLQSNPTDPHAHDQGPWKPRKCDKASGYLGSYSSVVNSFLKSQDALVLASVPHTSKLGSSVGF
jgi:hypothetical protein